MQTQHQRWCMGTGRPLGVLLQEWYARWISDRAERGTMLQASTPGVVPLAPNKSAAAVVPAETSGDHIDQLPLPPAAPPKGNSFP